MKNKILRVLTYTRKIRNRKVRILPLLLCFLFVGAVVGDLILHYQLSVDTTGTVELNPYYLSLTGMDDVPVSTVPFGAVMQGDQQWTDEYKLVLVNDGIEVSVAFNIAGSLAMGVTVMCYDNTTGTPVEWLEGNDYIKMMGGVNPTVFLLAFLVMADYTASAGSIGDFDLVWDSMEFYDPMIPASCDVLKTGSSEGHLWADEVGTGGDLTSFLWTGVYADGVTVWTSDMYLANMRGALGQITWTWVFTTGPSGGVTVTAMVEDNVGTMIDWPQSTGQSTAGVDDSPSNIRTVRWSITVPEGYSLGDILLGMTLDGLAG